MWFLPLYDENPSFRKPVLTYAIMALCVLWYFGYQIGQPPETILEYGFIPARLFAGYDPARAGNLHHHHDQSWWFNAYFRQSLCDVFAGR